MKNNDQENVPKRHHYVPDFLLQRFVDVKGLLHVWQKSTGKTWPTKPDGAFLETHLYRLLDEQGGDVSLEREYAKLEGHASRIIREWLPSVHGRIVPTITDEDRLYWDEFYFQQMKRVPQVLGSILAERTLSDRLSDIIPKLEEIHGRPATEEELAHLKSPEYLEKLENAVFIRAMRDPGDVVREMFQEMAVQFAVAPDDGEFALGSRPIVFKALNNDGTKMQNEYVQWWLPITPTIAVRLAGEKGTDSIFELTPETLDVVNKLVISQSDMIAARSPEVLQRFIHIQISKS